MVAATGGFVLVHVATALEVCEARDRKGLYAKARQGLIPEFTGISDPYETPADAELTLDTNELSAEDAAHRVLDYLEREGWLSRMPAGRSARPRRLRRRGHRLSPVRAARDVDGRSAAEAGCRALGTPVSRPGAGQASGADIASLRPLSPRRRP